MSQVIVHTAFGGDLVFESNDSLEHAKNPGSYGLKNPPSRSEYENKKNTQYERLKMWKTTVLAMMAKGLVDDAFSGLSDSDLKNMVGTNDQISCEISLKFKNAPKLKDRSLSTDL